MSASALSDKIATDIERRIENGRMNEWPAPILVEMLQALALHRIAKAIEEDE